MAWQTEGGGMCRSNVRNTSVSLGEISEDCVYVRPDVSSIWTETCSIQHRDLAMVMAEGPSRLGSLSGYSRQGWSTSVEEEMAGEGGRGGGGAERGLINRDQYCFARFLPLITYDKAGCAARHSMESRSCVPREARAINSTSWSWILKQRRQYCVSYLRRSRRRKDSIQPFVPIAYVGT